MQQEHGGWWDQCSGEIDSGLWTEDRSHHLSLPTIEKAIEIGAAAAASNPFIWFVGGLT